MSKDYLAAGPARGPLPGRQWLAAVVLIACTQLATLALAVGPEPQRGSRLFLALVVCGPIVLLRRWPLPVLAATAAANGLVMAMGNASLMDGIEATRRITTARGSRVLILTTFDLDEYVFDALRAGASGFALKSRPLEELLSAIRTIAAGDALLAPSVTRRLIAHFAGQARTQKPQEARPPQGLAELTEREREVLALVAHGLSNAELAQTLHVSLPTAKTHVSRILTKLGARDRTQLVVLAYESGLTSA